MRWQDDLVVDRPGHDREAGPPTTSSAVPGETGGASRAPGPTPIAANRANATATGRVLRTGKRGQPEQDSRHQPGRPPARKGRAVPTQVHRPEERQHGHRQGEHRSAARCRGRRSSGCTAGRPRRRRPRSAPPSHRIPPGPQLSGKTATIARPSLERQLDDPTDPFARAIGRVERGRHRESGCSRRPVAGGVRGSWGRRSCLPRTAPWKARSRRASRRPGRRPGGRRRRRGRPVRAPRSAPARPASAARSGRAAIRTMSGRRVKGAGQATRAGAGNPGGALKRRANLRKGMLCEAHLIWPSRPLSPACCSPRSGPRRRCRPKASSTPPAPPTRKT